MKTLKELLIDIVEEALYETQGNQSQAARNLDISRGMFRKYMKRIGYEKGFKPEQDLDMPTQLFFCQDR